MLDTPKVMMPRVLQVDSRWWFLGFVLLFSSFFLYSYFPIYCPASTWYQSKLRSPRWLKPPYNTLAFSQPSQTKNQISTKPLSTKTHHRASQIPTQKKILQLYVFLPIGKQQPPQLILATQQNNQQPRNHAGIVNPLLKSPLRDHQNHYTVSSENPIPQAAKSLTTWPASLGPHVPPQVPRH